MRGELGRGGGAGKGHVDEGVRQGEGERETVEADPARHGPQPGEKGCVLGPLVRVGQPAVGEHLLHDDSEPCVVRARERRGERGLEAVECSLHDVEDALAVDPGLERALERGRRGGAREGQAHRPIGTLAASPQQGAEQGLVVEAARLQGRAVDLVEIEPVAEECTGLRQLGGEAVERQFLLLVHGSLHRPAGRVAVAPLASHGCRLAGNAAFLQPAREELLRSSVAARHVEVADAAGAGGVEQLGRACRERRGRTLGRQVVGTAERDVARPADRGEAEPEARHDEPSRPEWKNRDHDPGRRRRSTTRLRALLAAFASPSDT